MLSVDEEFVHTVRTWKGKIYDDEEINFTNYYSTSPKCTFAIFLSIFNKINALHLTALIMTGCQTCF